MIPWLWRLCLLVLLACSGATGFAREAPAVDGIRLAELPPEARQTLALIRRGGPFPHERDGVIFGNFEKRLPLQKRGFYREYTVRTPGERSRGARRIVTGGDPPSVFYYTADHYRTFRRIEE